jgi:hypothetical protein
MGASPSMREVPPLHPYWAASMLPLGTDRRERDHRATAHQGEENEAMLSRFALRQRSKLQTGR